MEKAAPVCFDEIDGATIVGTVTEAVPDAAVGFTTAAVAGFADWSVVPAEVRAKPFASAAETIRPPNRFCLGSLMGACRECLIESEQPAARPEGRVAATEYCPGNRTGRA